MQSVKQKPKILVVDDDMNIRKLYIEFLKREKYLVEEADCGEKAIEKIQSKNYDLVISDLHMKKLGGLDVLRAAKKKDENTQVLILTGYGTVPTAVKAIKEGAFDYLTKPIRSETLLYKLRNALERRKMALRLREQEEAIERFHKMIERDLDLAKQVQSTLVPQNYHNDFMTVAVEYLPMIGLGGDIADIYDDKQGHTYLTIADVTGHGITAALMVNRVFSELRKYIRDRLSPAEVIYELNDFYYHSFSPLGIFITLMILVVDEKTGRLCYSGSAHPPMLLLRSSENDVVQLESQNKIIGFEPSRQRMEENEIDLHSGDRIVLYTDGIVESENARGEPFGFKRLQKTLLQHRSQSAQKMADMILAEVNRFSHAELKDDIMLMIAEIF